MARICRLLGKFQQADSLFNEALTMYRKMVDKDNPFLAFLLNNIASFIHPSEDSFRQKHITKNPFRYIAIFTKLTARTYRIV